MLKMKTQQLKFLCFNSKNSKTLLELTRFCLFAFLSESYPRLSVGAGFSYVGSLSTKCFEQILCLTPTVQSFPGLFGLNLDIILLHLSCIKLLFLVEKEWRTYGSLQGHLPWMILWCIVQVISLHLFS